MMKFTHKLAIALSRFPGLQKILSGRAGYPLPVLVLSVASLLVSPWVCTGVVNADNSGVVTSIKPVHSLVSAVMRGAGEPYLIMRGTSSPHTFSMRPSDARALENASIIFWVGERLETSLAGPIQTLGADAHVIELYSVPGVISQPFRSGGAFDVHVQGSHEEEQHADADMHEEDGHEDSMEDEFNPHVWVDPENAKVFTKAIVNALSIVDPENTLIYTANGRALTEKLDVLMAEVADTLAQVRGKEYIVFHDAYQNFEDRFGLTAVGSISVNPERPPGARRIADIRTKIQESGVLCIFSEVQFSPRLVDVIIEGLPVRTANLDPLGSLVENGPELYFSLIHNLASTFRECLMK